MRRSASRGQDIAHAVRDGRALCWAGRKERVGANVARPLTVPAEIDPGGAPYGIACVVCKKALARERSAAWVAESDRAVREACATAARLLATRPVPLPLSWLDGARAVAREAQTHPWGARAGVDLRREYEGEAPPAAPPRSAVRSPRRNAIARGSGGTFSIDGQSFPLDSFVVGYDPGTSDGDSSSATVLGFAEGDPTAPRVITSVPIRMRGALRAAIDEDVARRLAQDYEPAPDRRCIGCGARESAVDPAHPCLPEYGAREHTFRGVAEFDELAEKPGARGP